MVDVEARLEQWIAELKAQGHRITPQRMAVLRVLVTDSGHPSVHQVYEQVKAIFPMVSLATIYNTMALLKEIGAVLEIGVVEEGHRYDGVNPSPHPHLICTRCKEIIDLEPGDLAELSLAVARRTGYEISSCRIDFLGICPRCQQSR